MGVINDDVLQSIKSKGACLGLTTGVAVEDLSSDEYLKLQRLNRNDLPLKNGDYQEQSLRVDSVERIKDGFF